MLILPAENAINWRQPPVATIGLMLLCLFVFLFYQGKDPRLMTEAVERYLQSDLPALETPQYSDYLERQALREPDAGYGEDLARVRQAREEGNRVWLALSMLSDRAFYAYLQENRGRIWAEAQRRQWDAQREPIQRQLIDRLSANELGLIPARLDAYTLVSYQFLHGGWAHLIGNLVFLFLLGFTVEKALGIARYLVAYLLCGALSGLVFTGFSPASQMPLVGASGSISGLMGMYVAIYGLQRIRFFYFLGVYFNYLRAPALAMLPVWLGKEVYDYWFAGATGIAYMAHAGGLLAGAALVALFGRSFLQVRETFFEPEADEVDARFTGQYAQALASIGRMDFELARNQFEALRHNFPERRVVLEHLYQLAKLRPDLPAYRERARELMNEAMSQHQSELLVNTWQEYQRYGAAHAPLSAEDHNRVLFASLRHNELKTAEKAFEQLRQAGQPEMTREACRLLAEEFGKRRMEARARHYQQLMTTL